MSRDAAKRHQMIKSGDRWRNPILIGIPTLGTVRFEWANALWNCVLPVNWAAGTVVHPVPTIAPMRYHVAEAQNLIIKSFIEGKWEWLLLIEDDVVVPPELYIKMRDWMDKDETPIVTGLYYVKGNPRAPMIFRGRGGGAFNNWKPGEAVWCDGVATGCTLISRKLIEVAWAESPEIALTRMTSAGEIQQLKTREVFVTTRTAGVDPETGGYWRQMGTSDLEFCDRVIDTGWLKKAGYPKLARKKYPFVVDTSIKCGHIDLSTGIIY